MKRWLGFALLGLALAAACGPADSGPEKAESIGSAIEDGAVDTTHTFAVGIVQLSKLQRGEVAFCSGVLLAPNLVATARHCVSNLASAEITCATSMFGAVVPVADVLVTTDSTISAKGNLRGVSSIVVPPGAAEASVCGDDIALLVLRDNVVLPQYVTPVIDPPMTDQSVYSTRVTAIGYGVSTPTDEAGVTAGVRRIKEDVNLLCIPDDTTFADCFSDPGAAQVLSHGEFVSGDASTCEGDSGSGAYDQAAFDKGNWLAFGVLSRGAVSGDGGTCIQPIYERFDAWGPLLVSTAQQAAAAGHYPAPAWAGVTVEAGAKVLVASETAQGSGGCAAAPSFAAASLSSWTFGAIVVGALAARRRPRRRARHISAPTAGTCSQ